MALAGSAGMSVRPGHASRPIPGSGRQVARNEPRTVTLDGGSTPVVAAWASRSTSVANAAYRLESAVKIRRSKYKSRIRGATNTRPHQRPVAQSTTTTTAIQMASSSRITSDDFGC
jgi:hypothetical protein